MQIRTHATLDRSLCGTPRSLTQDASDVELLCDARMQADDRGLVHGGFLFGLADHAAMLAVNEPTVVLVEGTMQFTKPVVVGETVLARARVERHEGKRRAVVVDVLRGGDVVARATFSCAVPSRHVLDRA
jgi:uncharacterized protein (TIGR00369 family)